MQHTILIGSSSFGMSEEAVQMLTKQVALGRAKVVHRSDSSPVPLLDITGIIAGTELYDKLSLDCMPNLKVLSRMGVGLDHIDLDYCAANGITVTYTPYGPTQSVAQMTIGLMIALLRNMHMSNLDMRRGKWIKPLGRQFSEVSIGILGFGRIGSEVVRLLSAFNPKRIYVCDIDLTKERPLGTSLGFLGIEELFRRCDLVSLHIPLGKENFHLIDADLLELMKPGSLLVNTSRGALIDEDALNHALTTEKLSGAAIDVFEEEPYDGILTEFSSVICTPHVSSMTITARDNMEIGAVTDCLRVLENKQPINEVPHEL